MIIILITNLTRFWFLVADKQSFFNLALALLNKGDEVINSCAILVSYPDMVIIAEGTPVIVKCGEEQRFKITPEQLEAAITLTLV